MQALRSFALKLPETETGIACAGTAVECETVKVGGKAFLFLGKPILRLKLKESIAEAEGFASCKLGAGGWTAIDSSGDDVPALAVLKRWVEESYGLQAPKKGVKRANSATMKAGVRKSKSQ
jgi:hypothetical protein